MATLVIHTPQSRVTNGAKSFAQVLADGIGIGYAISQKDVLGLSPGCTVILLQKDRKKRRAEGQLIKLTPTNSKTPQGICRYDVHIKSLTEIFPYRPEKINHFGVAVF